MFGFGDVIEAKPGGTRALWPAVPACCIAAVPSVYLKPAAPLRRMRLVLHRPQPARTRRWCGIAVLRQSREGSPSLGPAEGARAGLPSVTGDWQYPGGGLAYSTSGHFGLNDAALWRDDLLELPVRTLSMTRLGRACSRLVIRRFWRWSSTAAIRWPIDDEFGSFGETTDAKLLAARLDEGLEALNLLWSGEPVTFLGKHVTIHDVTFRPVPVQRPRVPVCVGGNWPDKAPMPSRCYAEPNKAQRG